MVEQNQNEEKPQNNQNQPVVTLPDEKTLKNQTSLANTEKTLKNQASIANTEKTLKNQASVASTGVSVPNPPPQQPYCAHSRTLRYVIVFLISAGGLFGPICTSIYFPVLTDVARDLNVTINEVNLSISIFMVLQGISPTFWGSISDVLGRRPVYIITFLIFIGSCFGLANTDSYAVLMVLRSVQAFGSASVMALGSASIGDIADRAERGGFMGIFNVGPMLGPCIGPVVGGLLAHRWGWTAVFWLLGALGAIVMILMVLFLPETLRTIVGNGSVRATGIHACITSEITMKNVRNEELSRLENGQSQETIKVPPPKKTWKDIDWFAPYKIMFEKDAFLILAYNAISYACFMCVLTSMATSFDIYNLSQIELGLCYLSTGTGSLLSSFTNGINLNYDYRVVRTKFEAKSQDPENDRFPIERARLRSLAYAVGVQIVGTLAYGWTVNQHVHISAPLVFMFTIGFSSSTTFNTIGTLLVDLFPGCAGSAGAARNLTRCLLAAGGTAAISPLINVTNIGFAMTIVAGVNALFIPTLYLEWKNGASYQQTRESRIQNKESHA